MIYTSKDNWIGWYYDNREYFCRSISGKETLKTFHKNPNPRKINSLMTEAVDAAKSTMDYYSGFKPEIFFSGGIDSELMLKAFIKAGLNPNVYVVRYEDDINLLDVSYAITIANSLGIDIKIIDLNLKKLIENEAEKIADQAQMDRASCIPHCKFGDLVDGLPIIGMGDVIWQRTDSDYSKKGTWQAYEVETEWALDRYNLYHNRPGVFQWFKWTPELLLAHTQYQWFSKIINDEYPGKLGINSTKWEGYTEEFPDLIYRSKLTGFEKVKDLFREFENFIKRKNNGFIYRRQVNTNVNDYIFKIMKKPFSKDLFFI